MEHFDLSLLDDLLQKGEYGQIVNKVDQARKTNDSLNPLVLDRYYTAMRRANRVSEAMQILNQDLQMAKGNLLWVTCIYKELASCEWTLGKYERCEKLTDDAMALLPQLTIDHENLVKLKASLLLLKGILHGSWGNYSDAIQYHEEILELIGNEYAQESDLGGIVYNNIGVYFLSIGNYPKALEFLNYALKIQTKTGNLRSLGYNLLNLGIVYHLTGRFEEAEQAIIKTIDIWKQTENLVELATSYFELGYLYLSWKNPFKMQTYLNFLENHENPDKALKVEFQKKLLRALTIKASERLHQKFAAIPLFESLINEPVVNGRLTMIAMNQFCELLMQELEYTNNPDVLMEAHGLLERMIQVSKEQSLHVSYVQSLILQSKLEIIQRNLKRAQSLLELAKEFAEKHDMAVLLQEVDKQLSKIRILVREWKDNLDHNLEFAELLEQSEILDYLKNIQFTIQQG